MADPVAHVRSTDDDQPDVDGQAALARDDAHARRRTTSPGAAAMEEDQHARVRSAVHMFARCRSDTDNLAAFAVLTRLFSTRDLTQHDFAVIIDALPVDFLLRLLRTRDDDVSSDYHHFVLNVLSVLATQCTTRDTIERLRPIADAVLDLTQIFDPTHADAAQIVMIYMHLVSETGTSRDLHTILDFTCRHVKLTSEQSLPSHSLLDCVRLALARLADRAEMRERGDDANTRQITWPVDLRICIRRVLQTKASDDALRSLAFHVASLALAVVGGRTLLQSDPQFALVLAAINAVQLQMLLDRDPDQVNERDVVVACELAETTIALVEGDEVDFTDEHATALSRVCHDVAVFICEYLIAGNAERVRFRASILAPLFRCVCAFLGVGGVRIIDRGVMTKATPILVQIAEEALNREEADIAGLLIPSLAQLPNLPSSTLALLLAYLRRKYPTTDRRSAIEHVVAVISELTSSDSASQQIAIADRDDQGESEKRRCRKWMKPGDADEARRLARRIGNAQLEAAVADL